jgi:hypothetical protein
MTSTDVIRPMLMRRSTVSPKQIDCDAEGRITRGAIDPHDMVTMYRFKAIEPQRV